MSRIFIFTGKGGVGKSSVASAHARKSAAEGKRTILVSTDMAHNLSDIFEVPIGREITNLSENLDALEIDPEYVMRTDYQHFMQSFQEMLASPGIGMGEDADTVMFPGLEELFSLLKIADLDAGGAYDRIIVDCAPTGDTLALLKFPELLGWYFEHLFPVGKFAVRVLSPIAKHKYKLELPDGKGMNDIEKLYGKLIELQRLLKDNSKTSVRIVTIPEKMVVEETKRNYMYLNLFGYPVDGIYINRILPESLDNRFFGEWKKIQKKYGDELAQVFAQKPIYRIPWYETDLRGMHGIDRIAGDALTDMDVFRVNKEISGEIFEKTKEGYEMKISIPFAEKDDLSLTTNGADLILRLGNFKRSIPLPSTLTTYDITSAKLEKEQLAVCFSPRMDEKKDA
ncbi:MAG: ArsA family ATPase [Clostridiales bacterium]|nr:ArsA family ATPase [Clostridiales bacterium]